MSTAKHTKPTKHTNNKFFVLSYSFFPLESHNSIIPLDLHSHSIILQHVHASPQIGAPSVWDCKSKTKLVISPNLWHTSSASASHCKSMAMTIGFSPNL
jgi:hypothetical protein